MSARLASIVTLQNLLKSNILPPPVNKPATSSNQQQGAQNRHCVVHRLRRDWIQARECQEDGEISGPAQRNNRNGTMVASEGERSPGQIAVFEPPDHIDEDRKWYVYYSQDRWIEQTIRRI